MKASSHFIALAVGSINQVSDVVALDLPNHEDLLDSAEIKHCESLRLSLDKLRFIASRKLLRGLLSEYGYPSPSSWRFEKLSTGQWKLKAQSGTPHFHLSTSHTDQLVAVAISQTLELGVDIEQVPEREKFLMIDDALSLQEKQNLPSPNSNDYLTKLLQLWTAKEAYSKLCGMGSELEFNQVSIGTDPTRLLSSPLSEKQLRAVHFWSVRAQLKEQLHLVNVAYRNLANWSVDLRLHNPASPFLDTQDRSLHGAA